MDQRVRQFLAAFSILYFFAAALTFRMHVCAFAAVIKSSRSHAIHARATGTSHLTTRHRAFAKNAIALTPLLTPVGF